jgi:hypothetical protein
VRLTLDKTISPEGEKVGALKKAMPSMLFDLVAFLAGDIDNHLLKAFSGVREKAGHARICLSVA